MHVPRRSRSNGRGAGGTHLGSCQHAGVRCKDKSRSEEKFSEYSFSKKEKKVIQHKNIICGFGNTHFLCFKKQTKSVNGIETSEEQGRMCTEMEHGPVP